MRLLSSNIPESGELTIKEVGDPGNEKYAILSHRWGDKEITLKDVESGSYNKTSEAYVKIQGCCKVAKRNNIDWVWIDTCCIDKTSSAELSEAINSMYFWYAKADVCYAYLNDVFYKDEFSNSVWFTRGWTLQELIAPSNMKFFNRGWQYLGNKLDFINQLSACTGIPTGILSGKDDLESLSVAKRMSWAAKRETTRIEDQAYCLMGIFGINMPLLYGERENAFIRLQEEILRLSDDPTLFAWRSTNGKGLLAPSPAAFLDSRNIVRSSQRNDLHDPPSISSRGICLRVPIMGVGPGVGLIILDCQQKGSGNKMIALYMQDIFLKRDPWLTMQQFTRVWPEDFKEIDLKNFQNDRYSMRKIWARSGRVTGTQRPNAGDTATLLPELYPDEQFQRIMKLGPQVAFQYVMSARSEEESLGLAWCVLVRQDIEKLVKMNKSLGSHFIRPNSEVNQSITFLFTMLVSQGLTLEQSTWWEIMEIAIKQKDESMILSILKGHDMTDSKSEFREEALEFAAKLGDESVINAILEYAGWPEQASRLIHQAAMHDKYFTAKMLIKRGAPVNEWNSDYAGTPLIQAVLVGHENLVKLLLQNGATVSTELIDAANRQGRPSIARLLNTHSRSGKRG